MKSSVTACVIQTGPLSPDKDQNIERNLRLLAKAASKNDLDFVLYPELSTTPFWPVGLRGKDFFEWAEPVPGSATARFAKAAKKYGTYIILPLFEKGDIEGQYYNSAAVISPSGEIVRGVLPGGRKEKVKTTRKNYISEFAWDSGENNEKLFFSPGRGHPIFPTSYGPIGVLICYERWFVEAWRVLTLGGAKMVFVPNASSGYVSEMFIPLMKTCAAQNLVFGVAANKAGRERIRNKVTNYYGLSCIVAPDGSVLTQASKFGEDEIISARLDLGEIDKQRRSLFIFRDRRPELYSTIVDSG